MNDDFYENLVKRNIERRRANNIDVSKIYSYAKTPFSKHNKININKGKQFFN